ncbi:Bestrophin-3 [Amphibalanus amphitrite]|uniref:Bestrophin homolog n=1 Tax=Amphibalanus amphitrite TaxID=1232801 RepID=A0A6A4WMR2_AMPAM|nr:Bestrophin-3 [Amphibalanus amphitrite]
MCLCVCLQDDRGRLIRRTIMRYVNLSFVYTMSQVCTRVKKRFPTLDHLVEAGIMTDTEKKIFELMNKKTPHLKYWMPLVWAGSIVTKARKEGRIRDDFAVKTLVDSINTFRSGLGSVLNYDWISVPLVYTQTVTLAVYTFFIAELMGRQFVKGNEPDHETIDLYVPIFTFLQFFFYMGWLRVAETLFNPFGDDDDDFEINWMIDRNLQVSYIIVDEMHEDHPELVRDQYWEDVIPADLPYTVAAEQYRREPPQGSAAQIDVKKTEMVVTDAPPTIPEEEEPEIRTLVTPKDVEAAQSSVIADSLRPPPTSAMDIGGSGSPGAGGDPHEPLSPTVVGSATTSLESRLSGAMQTASLKRSVRGLMNKLSNRVRVSDTPTNVLDEMFVMSDLDLAAGSRGSLPADSASQVGGEPRDPLLGRTTSVPESEECGSPQRRLSGSSEGSEDRPAPKFLPGDYNFMITTVPEEEEEESVSGRTGAAGGRDGRNGGGTGECLSAE